MKKRITSICLIIALMITNLGFTPSAEERITVPVSSLIDELDAVATPSTATKAEASPATATDSEATPSVATESVASEKILISVDPEEEDIPEYYVRTSYSGEKFWKFEDRYGEENYRNYGYIQGDAEFPEWYEVDGTGAAVKDSIDLDEEYYDLAPYLYQSATPEETDWSSLSWKILNSSDGIAQYNKTETGSFDNWDSSSYQVWKLEAIDDSTQVLGYYFFGNITNMEEGSETSGNWYYADKEGSIYGNVVAINVMAATTSYYRPDIYYSRPGLDKRTTQKSGANTTSTYYDLPTYTASIPTNSTVLAGGVDFASTFIGYSGGTPNTDNDIAVSSYYMCGDPAKGEIYSSAGTFYPSDYERMYLNVDHPDTLYGLWCPENADAYVFVNEKYTGETSKPTEILGVLVGRDEYKDISVLGEPDASDYEFTGWINGHTNEELDLNEEGQLYFGHSGTITYVYPSVEDVETYEVKFVDWDGTPIGETQHVLAGQSAEAPEVPERYGYTFEKWSKATDYTKVTKNMTVKAGYTENKQITVNFRNYQYEGIVNHQEAILYTQTVYEGESISVPELDLKDAEHVEGYTLTGNWTWNNSYFDGNFDSMYLNPKKTTDEVLEVWPEKIKNTHTVYLHANDGTGRVEEFQVEYGSSINTATKDFYTRDGYSGYPRLDEMGTALEDYAMPDYDIDMYMFWTAKSYSIKYVSNLTGVSNPSTGSLLYGSSLNLTKKVSKTGYVFLGWYYSADADSTDKVKAEDTMPSTTLTVYGHWALATNNVTFKDADDTEIGTTQNIAYGEMAVAPEDPASTESGKEFRGWFTEKEGGKRVKVEETPIRKETVLYAQYGEEIPIYTVSFVNRNGDVIGKQYVDAGGAAIISTENTDAEMEGYAFTGWDTDFTNIQADTIVHAQYKTNTYTLTVSVNSKNNWDYGFTAYPTKLGNIDGEQIKTYEVEYGADINQILKEAEQITERENYSFDGWFDARESGNQYSYSSENKMPAQNLTVYAQWTQEYATVMYSRHNYSGSDEFIGYEIVHIGDYNTLPELPQLPDGFQYCNGWNETTGDWSSLPEPTRIYNDKSIELDYSVLHYTLTFDGNGGTFNKSETRQYSGLYAVNGYNFDSNYITINNDVDKTRSGWEYPGHILLGWYTLPIGGTKLRSAGNCIISEDITLYAHWSSNVYYVVTYVDWNGDILGTEEVWPGDETTPPTPTRTGYTFVGWDVEPTEITENVTFTAQYVEGMNLVFKGNGGTVDGKAIKAYAVTSGDSFDSQLAECKSAASRQYYAFDGWYTKAEGGTKYADSGNVMTDDPIIIYAHWTRVSSSVVFEDWQDKILSTQDIPLGGDAVPPEVPKRTGYEFVGWDKDYTNIQDHMVIKAQYEAASYTLTIDGNGGTMDRNDKLTYLVKYGADIREIFTEAINKLTWLNHTLRGLYTEATEGTKYSLTDEINMPGSDKTVYAQWTSDTNLVTYKNWNGTTIKTQNVPIGENATPPEVPVRTGYNFTGWDKESTNILEDTVITAQYTIGSYQLSLSGNGGTVGEDQSKTQEFVYGESIDQFLEDGRDEASREYYSFDGWFTKAVDGIQYLYDGSTMPGEDTTLYAHWTRSYNEVIYKDWNGAILDIQKISIGGDAAPPENPERTGYTFTGWDKESTNIQADTVITAQYSKNSYQLTLDGNGGTIDGELIKTESIGFGESIDQILVDGRDNASREYYTFAGWYTEPTGGEKYSYSGITMPAANVTVYAHWTRSSNEVIYKDWSGLILDTQEVLIGSDATPPTDPERTGYTFTGWDKESTNIQADTVITAQYSKNSYQLTLDGNGGTVNGEQTQTESIGFREFIDQILVDGRDNASREYYTFAGWYTEPTGGEKYSYSGNTMPAANITVYAHWSRSSNEVIYKDWNGTILDTQDVVIGEDAIPPENPERTGYTFTGWDKESTNIHVDTVITAQYSKNSYQLTLDGNGGTIDGDSAKTETVVYGASIDEILINGKNHAILRHYTFEGWYTAQTGGEKYSYSGITMPAGNITVYAHWTRSSNEVIYKDWNGTILDTQEVAIGEDAIPPENPERTGYTFTGWDKESTNIQADTVITAQYSKNSYQLTLDGNGGTIEGDSAKTETVVYGASIDEILINGKDHASHQYYSFDGWYTAQAGGDKYSYIGNTMPAGNMTLYAHWTQSSTLVTYKDWNGTVLKTQEVAIGGDAVPPEDPERTGYTFTAWDKESTNIQADTVITAQYSKNSYQLTLDGNGGTVNGEQTKTESVGFGESIDQILVDGRDNVSREYYTFAGWYTEPTGGEKYSYSGNIMPAANETVYAHWTRSSNLVTYEDWNKTVLKTQEVLIGEDVTPPADPERTGYTFTGWDKESTNIQADTVITAQYSKNSYQLTLDGNGGTVNGEQSQTESIGFGESIDQILVDGRDNASREYYTFAGWYIEPTGGEKYSYSGNIMPARNMTVYAHWTEKVVETCLVTYQDWDGTVLDVQKVAIGSNATPPESPKRSGYTFTAWDTESTNIQADTVITALYSKNIYLLTLDGNGGTINGDTVITKFVKYGASFDQTLIDGRDSVSRSDYTFTGWYTDPVGGEKYSYSGNTMPVGNITIYAHWTEKETSVIEVPTTDTETISDSDDEETEAVVTPVTSQVVETVTKEVPNDGGTFTVNPEDPYDVTYTKDDGTTASDEWVGDGTDWYHINENSKIDYSWFLEGKETWYMLNAEPGERFGAAIVGWFSESMDDKKYYFDPVTSEMLTGWQELDGKWYYFTTRNEGQTYFGSNGEGWVYDPERPGKPYGSMYRNEYTPDGHYVDENGTLVY